MKLGVIGCGAIGRRIVSEALMMEGIETIYVHDRHGERAESLTTSGVHIANPSTMLDECELIVEAASPAAVREIVLPAVDRGIDVIVMSSGAFADRPLFREIERRAAVTAARVFVPSGAICGIDALKAAAVGGIERLEINTYKRPGSIRPTDEFLERTGIDLVSIDSPTLVFEGAPEEGIRYFPRNVNVSATLDLAAGAGVETVLRVYIDPNIEHNRHEIVLEGTFGRLVISLDNVPSENPGTSELAVLSAISTLRSILSPVRIGT